MADKFTCGSAAADGDPFLSGLGCQIKSHVNIEFFINEHVAPLLASGLVALALSIIVFYLLAIYLPLKIKLFKANKALDSSMEGAQKGDSEHKRQYFARNFFSLSKELSSNRALAHGWQEFRETLILPEDAQRGVVQNMVRPQSYINIREGFGRWLTPKFLAIFPNLFVGIGLLLTFVGLVAALMVTTNAMGGGDMKAMQGALKDLLGAASLKFWTSVAGLGCSIGLTIAHRFFMASLERSYSRIGKKLEQGMLFVSQEDLVQQQLEELKEQSAQLKHFNTEIGVTLGNSIKEAMTPVMSSAMEPMINSFEELKEILQKSGEKTVEAVHSGLGDVVQGAAGSEMKDLAVTLQSLGATLGETKEAIGALKDGAADQMRDASTAMQEATTAMHHSMNGVSENISHMMGDMVAQSRQSMEGLTQNMTHASAGMTNGVMNVVDRMQETLQQASGQSSQMGQAFESQMSGAIVGMTSLLERVGSQNEEMTGLLQRQSEESSRRFAEEITNALSVMQEKVEESVQQTSGQSSQMGQAFEQQMSGAMEGMTGLLERVGSQNEAMTSLLQRQSEESVRRFADESARASHVMHEKVQESLHLTSGQTTQMGQAFESQMSLAISGMTSLLERVGGQNEEMTALLQRQSEESSRRFAEEIANALRIMQEKVEESVQQTSGQSSQMGQAFEQQMSGAMEGMTSLLERVGSQNEAMTSLLQRQSEEATRRFADETGRATQAMHEKVQESLQLASGQSSQMGEQFETQMAGAMQGMTTVLERLGDQNEEMTKLLQDQSERSIKRFASEMEKASATIVKQVAEIMGKTEGAARQMEEAGIGVAKAATPLSGLGTSLVQATKHMEEAQDKALENLRGIHISMTGSAQELIEGMRSTSQAATQAWQSYQGRFEQVDEHLEKAMRGMAEHLSANQGHMLKYVNAVDSELGSAVGKLGGGIDGLRDIVEEVHEISKSFSAARSGANAKGKISNDGWIR